MCCYRHATLHPTYCLQLEQFESNILLAEFTFCKYGVFHIVQHHFFFFEGMLKKRHDSLEAFMYSLGGPGGGRSVIMETVVGNNY